MQKSTSEKIESCFHTSVSRSCNAPSVVWTCDACGAKFNPVAEVDDHVLATYTHPLAPDETDVVLAALGIEDGRPGLMTDAELIEDLRRGLGASAAIVDLAGERDAARASWQGAVRECMEIRVALELPTEVDGYEVIAEIGRLRGQAERLTIATHNLANETLQIAHTLGIDIAHDYDLLATVREVAGLALVGLRERIAARQAAVEADEATMGRLARGLGGGAGGAS